MTAESFQRVCATRVKAGAAGIAWVQALRDRALAKIAAGGGQIYVVETGSGAGKTFGRRTLLDCVIVADICDQALADGRNGGAGDTYAATSFDFSQLD